MVKRWIDRKTIYNTGGGNLGPGDAVAVKYVTVIGYAGDFVVYMGQPYWTGEEVAANGDKVPEEAGRVVAPYCSHLRYRT